MTREIKKAKITNGNTLEVSLIEHHPDKTEREVVIKCQQLAHNDMLVAFSKLTLHLASICELHEAKELEPEKFDPTQKLINIKVTSFSIGGHDEHEGVTITGQKELEGGKILNLNSPFQKYEDEIAPYKWDSELAADIHACVFEVEQYMFEGKYAVKQLELPFEESAADAVTESLQNLKEGLDGENITMTVSSSRKKKTKTVKLQPATEQVMEMEEAATY